MLEIFSQNTLTMFKSKSKSSYSNQKAENISDARAESEPMLALRNTSDRRSSNDRKANKWYKKKPCKSALLLQRCEAELKEAQKELVEVKMNKAILLEEKIKYEEENKRLIQEFQKHKELLLQANNQHQENGKCQFTSKGSC